MTVVTSMDGVSKVSLEGVTGVQANLLRCDCGMCGSATSVDLVYATGRTVTIDHFDCYDWRVGEYGANEAAVDRAKELQALVGLSS